MAKNYMQKVIPSRSQVYRYWIKRFAEQNYRFEHSRKPDRPMWPFVAIMEDNSATWTMSKCSPDNPKIRYYNNSTEGSKGVLNRIPK